MGGSAPTPVVQSNEGQMDLLKAQMRQNDLLYAQQERTMKEQGEADMAAEENLRMINIRDAEAQQEADEREARQDKGKKDLLYRSGLGVEDDEEEDNFLKLGGNV